MYVKLIYKTDFWGYIWKFMEMELDWFFLVGLGKVYRYAKADTILLIYLINLDFLEEVLHMCDDRVMWLYILHQCNFYLH